MRRFLSFLLASVLLAALVWLAAVNRQLVFVQLPLAEIEIGLPLYALFFAGLLAGVLLAALVSAWPRARQRLRARRAERRAAKAEARIAALEAEAPASARASLAAIDKAQDVRPPAILTSPGAVPRR